VSNENKHFGLALVVFALAASFYLYEFILQVSPAVMTEDLMRDFNVHATGMAMIVGAYFYSYTFMQIPAGMLFDRYGPRLLLTISILLCVLGCALFASTENNGLAALGRVLMGIGSAFSFIGVLVLTARWFLPQQFALMLGIAQALSSVGAILGEYPVAFSVEHLSWRTTLFLLAGVGLVLALATWCIVRDYPPGMAPVKTAEAKTNNEWAKLVSVCANSQLWYLGAYSFLVWAPIVVFAGLWGVPFLALVYGISDSLASLYLSVIWLGIGVGSMSLGWWTDAIKCRNKPLQLSALLGVAAVTILVACPGLSMPLLIVVLFVFGFSAGGQAISFAVIKDIYTKQQLGTASGFNNMATVAGGICLQPLIGVGLELLWQGDYAHGVPFYTIANYQVAFMVLPLCYVLATFFSVFLIKETHCLSHN
jgi:MFS family permease